MSEDNYFRQFGPSWLGFYFSRFLSSRVLRLHVFGRTYRFAWTWHFEAERVRASKPELEMTPALKTAWSEVFARVDDDDEAPASFAPLGRADKAEAT